MVHRVKFGLNHPKQSTFSVCSIGKASIANKELMPQQRNLLCPSCFQPSLFIVEASQKSVAKFASFSHLPQHRVPQMTFLNCRDYNPMVAIDIYVLPPINETSTIHLALFTHNTIWQRLPEPLEMDIAIVSSPPKW